MASSVNEVEAAQLPDLSKTFLTTNEVEASARSHFAA